MEITIENFESKYKALTGNFLPVSYLDNGTCCISFASKKFEGDSKEHCIEKILFEAKKTELSKKHAIKTDESMLSAIIVESVNIPIMTFAYEYLRDLRVLQYFEDHCSIFYKKAKNKDKKRMSAGYIKTINSINQTIKRLQSDDYNKISEAYDLSENHNTEAKEMTIDVFTDIIRVWRNTEITRKPFMPAILQEDESGDYELDGVKYKVLT